MILTHCLKCIYIGCIWGSYKSWGQRIWEKCEEWPSDDKVILKWNTGEKNGDIPLEPRAHFTFCSITKTGLSRTREVCGEPSSPDFPPTEAVSPAFSFVTQFWDAFSKSFTHIWEWKPYTYISVSRLFVPILQMSLLVWHASSRECKFLSLPLFCLFLHQSCFWSTPDQWNTEWGRVTFMQLTIFLQAMQWCPLLPHYHVSGVIRTYEPDCSQRT